MLKNLKGAMDVDYEVVQPKGKKKMSEKKKLLIEIAVSGLVIFHVYTMATNSISYTMLETKYEDATRAIKVYETYAKQIEEQAVQIKTQDRVITTLSSRGVDVKKAEKIVQGEARQNLIKKINNKVTGKMKGKGEYIVNKCLEGNTKIDPDLLVAVYQHETGNGTSRAFRELNNPGGLMNPNTGKLWDFSKTGLEEGIDKMVQTLKNYKKEGKVTISQIQKKYCPVGAANDPTGLNKYWLSCVTKNYHNLKEDV